MCPYYQNDGRIPIMAARAQSCTESLIRNTWAFAQGRAFWQRSEINENLDREFVFKKGAYRYVRTSMCILYTVVPVHIYIDLHVPRSTPAINRLRRFARHRQSVSPIQESVGLRSRSRHRRHILTGIHQLNTNGAAPLDRFLAQCKQPQFQY
eukprot:COSAG02_NODE_475_length_21552_cov_4.236470_9_plen_152_part_00